MNKSRSLFQFVLIGCATILLHGSGCDESSPNQPNVSVDPIQLMLQQTPRADTEAELIALHLSRELVADESLYRRIHSDLKKIRREHSEHIIDTFTRFRGPWRESHFGFKADTSILFQAGSQARTTFDSLAEYYRSDRMWLYSYYLYDSLVTIGSLNFQGVINPSPLMAAFRSLPGIEWVSSSVNVADGSDIYVLPGRDTLRYFFFYDGFYDGGIDGIAYAYTYFISEHGRTRYVDEFVSYFDDRGEPPHPLWWDTLKMAYDTTAGYAYNTRLFGDY